jgi:uncharacterized protein (DUF2384 family)
MTELQIAMARALLVFNPQVAMDWLVGREPFLGNERPIDVLMREGATPLIAALDAFEALAHA